MRGTKLGFLERIPWCSWQNMRKSFFHALPGFQISICITESTQLKQHKTNRTVSDLLVYIYY